MGKVTNLVLTRKRNRWCEWADVHVIRYKLILFLIKTSKTIFINVVSFHVVKTRVLVISPIEIVKSVTKLRQI